LGVWLRGGARERGREGERERRRDGERGREGETERRRDGEVERWRGREMERDGEVEMREIEERRPRGASAGEPPPLAAGIRRWPLASAAGRWHPPLALAAVS
jgi:hypothetical protein